MGFADTSLPMVRSVIGGALGACESVPGYFPYTISVIRMNSWFSVVRLDCDLYEPMKAGLEFFYPRMPKGGLFFFMTIQVTSGMARKRRLTSFA